MAKAKIISTVSRQAQDMLTVKHVIDSVSAADLYRVDLEDIEMRCCFRDVGLG